MRTAPSNRGTTVESLEACFELIYADNKEDFAKAYDKATHDVNGKTMWGEMYRSHHKKKIED